MRVLLEPHHCMPAGERRREIAHCGQVTPEVTFRVDRSPAHPRFDLNRTRCAAADPIPPAAEPWRPFIEAEVLCGDPYAWCGSPIVLELRQPDGDPCGGSTFEQRCDASIEGGRIIVLRAETARSASDRCLPVIGDRVARCVVPPLATGTYEVVDGEGRALGIVDVPSVQSSGELEPTCEPFP